MKIHLRQLPADVTEEELRELLGRFAAVRELSLLGPDDTEEPAAVAEIEGGAALADTVRQRLDGTVLRGKPILVDTLPIG